MSPVLTRKLKLLELICAFSACAGMFYQRVGEETIGSNYSAGPVRTGMKGLPTRAS